jgi:large subunit ribosomal protein L10
LSAGVSDEEERGDEALRREEKKQVISGLKDRFEKATGVIFTDYKGLTVQEISELRKQLKEASLDYKVVKNSLAKRAIEGTPIETAKDVLAGPIGIAISYEDPAVLAKKVLAFVKTNEKLEIRGGVFEGKTCEMKDIKAISELPSREILLATFIGTMQSPLSKLVAALNATVSRFVYALEAVKNNRKE